MYIGSIFKVTLFYCIFIFKENICNNQILSINIYYYPSTYSPFFIPIAFYTTSTGSIPNTYLSQ